MEYASFQKYCSKVVISEENFSLFPLKLLLEIVYCCKIISSKKKFIKIFYGKFFTGICFSLEIVIQNHNTKHNFSLF